MRRRLQLLFVGIGSAALLSAGLVVAQTAEPQSPAVPAAPASAAPPPANELPPQETAPSAPDRTGSGDKDKVEAGGDTDATDADKAAEQAQAPAIDPNKREAHGAAVVEALDKITAETMRFEIKTGQSLRWKGLVFTLRTCETSAPAELVKDSIAYLTVRSEPRIQSDEASREVFRGWMFASSPALNPMRHPVYDAWLIACRA